MRSLSVVTSALVLPLVLAACGGGSSNAAHRSAAGAPNRVVIPIRGFKFTPAIVTVRAGGHVRFVNHDRADHTATGAPFDTGSLHAGDSKTVELRKPGTFEYRCDFHPFMTGELSVVK
jgi:plastocyanin